MPMAGLAIGDHAPDVPQEEIGSMNRNSPLRRLLGALVLPVAIIGGCKMESTSSREGRVESLHPDARNEVTAKVGVPFTLTLPGNAGTGYEWVIAGDVPSFLKQRGAARFVPTDSSKVGAGGDSEFVLEASEAGKGVIRFHYLRSWKKDARPARWSEAEVTANTGGQ